MKPDGATVRQFGRRPLHPSFLLGTKSLPKEGEPVRPSKKVVSLSDFLDRKLGKTKPAVTSRSAQEKGCCFSSVRSISSPFGSTSAKIGESLALDGSIFRRFNATVRGDDCASSSEGGEVGGELKLDSRQDRHDSRKRKDPFVNSAGENEGPAAKRLLLVLGDDPKPRQKGRDHRVRDNMEKPLFNHYGNGAGWWDCDREGVDSEEVGCSEVWEGMGSTTVGGLEWH
ncbi:hypothetical protein Taro_049524 [Colocasia esculenta]|uniref:Uncharacterized protein n=1 Tax=Colocasia esculenta TaxID=4460 RepID=A0A843XB05_COLES|nr:hypothetical protein [Colocasia esculenta]